MHEEEHLTEHAYSPLYFFHFGSAIGYIIQCAFGIHGKKDSVATEIALINVDLG